MIRPFAAVLVAVALAGCADAPRGPVYEPAPVVAAPQPPRPAAGASRGGTVAAYRAAAARVEPVAEAMCRDADTGRSRRYCAFDFRLVDDPRLGPNAFQTVGSDGTPIVAMTMQLVAETQNADEIAFILGHEAAHHISDHIAKSQTQAAAGALVLGTLAGLGNASDATIRDMMNIGASLGGRVYSQSYELEADSLGAYIAARAGYDPVRGAVVFTRPALAGGGGLLSTHPASAQRQSVVAGTAAEIRRQQAAGLAPHPANAPSRR